jgi:WD40 repeat protein
MNKKQQTTEILIGLLIFLLFTSCVASHTPSASTSTNTTVLEPTSTIEQNDISTSTFTPSPTPIPTPIPIPYSSYAKVSSITASAENLQLNNAKISLDGKLIAYSLMDISKIAPPNFFLTHQVIIIDAQSKDILQTINLDIGRGGFLTFKIYLAFSPDGTKLVTASEYEDMRFNIQLWDTSTGKLIRSANAMGINGDSLSYNSDGSLIGAAGVGTHRIYLWNGNNLGVKAVMSLPR